MVSNRKVHARRVSVRLTDRGLGENQHVCDDGVSVVSFGSVLGVVGVEVDIRESTIEDAAWIDVYVDLPFFLVESEVIAGDWLSLVSGQR